MSPLTCGGLDGNYPQGSWDLKSDGPFSGIMKLGTDLLASAYLALEVAGWGP